MPICKACNAPITARKVADPNNPKGSWRHFEPVTYSDGSPIEAYVKNGTGSGPQRYAWRYRSSTVAHVCRVTSPVRSDETPMTRDEWLQRHFHGQPPQDAPVPQPNPQFTPPAPGREDAPVPSPGFDLDRIKGEIRAEVVSVIKGFGIQPPPTRHEFKGPRGTYQTEPGEVIHANVPRVIRYLGRNKHVYAYGPAGSGKTHGLLQAARLAGRTDVVVVPFAGMSYGRLFGHTTVSGEWQKGLLSDPCERGMVVIADEFDRCLPQVSVSLNAVLENGFFNDGTRQVKVGGTFCMLASGNTDGRGATRAATSAQPMDAPTLKRFAFVAWPYDEDHERGLVGAILPEPEASKLTAWTRAVRALCDREHVESIVCGPREARNIAEDVINGERIADAIDARVWCGVSAETRERILRACPIPEIG